MKEIPCLEINDIKDTNLYSRINREVHSYKKVMLIQGASIFFIPIIFSLAIIMILSGDTEFDISDLIMNAIFGGATFLFIFLLFTFAFGLIFKYSLTSLFQKYPNLTKTIYIGDNVEETTQIIKKTKNERIIKIFGFLWDMAGMKNILSWNLVNQLPYANGAVMFQTPNQLFIPTAYVLNSNSKTHNLVNYQLMQEGNYAALFVYWNYTQSLSTAYAIAIFDSKYEKEILDKIRQLDPNVRSN